MFYANDYDLEPAHPGKLLQQWIGRGIGLTAAGVASKAYLSLETVEGILAGEIDIDFDIADGLRNIFGASARGLFCQQKEHNYFKSTGLALPHELIT